MQTTANRVDCAAVTAILTVQGVEKSFGSRRILRGVSFAVHERDRIALVGVNGSGKSTLLRLIVGDAGEDHGASAGGRDAEPDAGLITRRRDLTLEYVAQEPRLDGGATVAEAVAGGLRAHAALLSALHALEAQLPGLDGDRLDVALARQAALHQRVLDGGGWERDHEVRGISAALSLPPAEARVATLSIGERRRVALARALIARPDLLALDEPTNHLDAATIAWLEGRLLEQAGALLLVTHDRYFLDRVATRILELDRGQIHAYEGGYARFLDKQADRLADEAGREHDRASFVRRELDWIRRGPQARTTKQQARIDRFDAAVAAAPRAEDKKAGPVTLRLPTGGRLGKTILELRGIGKRLGGKALFEGLTLSWKPGDRVGVVGPNGAGKTTLVRTILGQLAPDTGEVVVGQNTRFAFLDQGRADLRDDHTVLEEVAGDGDHVLLPEHGTVHVRTFLRMLLFDDGFADTPVGTLSGGERNRVQLAKLLRAGGNFLILDEPTNDLDLMTLGVLEEALSDFPGCALLVSHDRWFLDRVATAILAFEGDGRVVFHEGNYSDYLARTARERTRVRAAVAPPAALAATPGAAGPPPTRGRKLSFKEKQELAGIEAAIAAAEARVAEAEAALVDPAIYQGRAEVVPARVAALDAARTEVEHLYARWQELEALANV